MCVIGMEIGIGSQHRREHRREHRFRIFSFFAWAFQAFLRALGSEMKGSAEQQPFNTFHLGVIPQAAREGELQHGKKL